MSTETFTNGPRLAVQHHQGQGDTEVGDLLAHEERIDNDRRPGGPQMLKDTRDAVRAWERGDTANATAAMGGIIALYAAGRLPKKSRAVSALLGFRSENGAVRPLKVAQAAMAGVPPVITPARRPTDPPKSIPDPVRYKSWPAAVAAQGITACYAAAKAALSDVKELPTRREAFAKAVYSRIAGLRQLTQVGDVPTVLSALLGGRLMSQKDIEAFYLGPDGDLPMERGTTWDDVAAEMLAADDDGDEALETA